MGFPSLHSLVASFAQCIIRPIPETEARSVAQFHAVCQRSELGTYEWEAWLQLASLRALGSKTAR